MKITELGRFLSDAAVRGCSHDAKGVLFILLPYLIRRDGVLICGTTPINRQNILDYVGDYGLVEAFDEIISLDILRDQGGGVFYAPAMMGTTPKRDKYTQYPEMLRDYTVNKSDPDHIRLAAHMYLKWSGRFPKNIHIRNATLKPWAEACRKMNEIDERDYKEIFRAFEFVLQDDWWSKAFYTPDALRKNFDKILMAMDRNGGAPKIINYTKREYIKPE